MFSFVATVKAERRDVLMMLESAKQHFASSIDELKHTDFEKYVWAKVLLSQYEEHMQNLQQIITCIENPKEE